MEFNNRRYKMEFDGQFMHQPNAAIYNNRKRRDNFEYMDRNFAVHPNGYENKHRYNGYNNMNSFYSSNNNIGRSNPMNIKNNINLSEYRRNRSDGESYTRRKNSQNGSGKSEFSESVSSNSPSFASSPSSPVMWNGKKKYYGRRNRRYKKPTITKGPCNVPDSNVFYALPKFLEAPSPDTLPMPPLHWYKPELTIKERSPSTVNILEALFNQCSLEDKQWLNSPIPLNNCIPTPA